MTIGKRLRSLRKSRGWSQERLGEALAVSKGMVSQWENDIVTIPIDRLLELAKHVEFSFDWLLKGQPSLALQIEHSLQAVHQEQAWYVVGRALAQPPGGPNNSN